MWGEILVEQVKYASAFLATLILPLVLLYSFVRIMVMQPSYFINVLYSEEYNLSDRIDLSQTDTERVLNKLFKYVLGDEESPVVVVKVGDERVSFYNERELVHLEDVKALLEKIRFFMIFIIVFEILMYGFIVRGMPYTIFFKILCTAEIIHIGLVGAILGVANKSMVWFVSLFHRVLFDNNRWILNDATERLVLLFPKVLYKEILVNFVAIWFIMMTIINIFIIVKMRRVTNGNI